VKASTGPGSAHARRQAIDATDATDFDATARTTKPHVNRIRGKLTVWGVLVLLPKQSVAGSNPVSRSNPQEPRLHLAWVSLCPRYPSNWRGPFLSDEGQDDGEQTGRYCGKW
jgi:hypothetical protein